MVRAVDVLRCRPLLRGLPAVLALAPHVGLAGDWQSSLALTSDYIQRGISQNDGEPALQGSLTYWSSTGWYAGAWGSQVDPRGFTADYYGASGGADAEVNLFVGLSRRFGSDWVVDLKAVEYFYPDDPAPVSYDYVELAVSVAWRERIYASLAVSPSMTWLASTGGVRNRPAYDAGLSLQQPLSPWLTWMLGTGYRELVAQGVEGYFYGSTSLVVQWQRCTFELGYYTTDRQAERLFGARLAGGRTAFTAAVSF